MLLRKAAKQAFQFSFQLAAQLRAFLFGGGHGRLIAHPCGQGVGGQTRAGKRARMIPEGIIAAAAQPPASIRHAEQRTLPG